MRQNEERALLTELHRSRAQQIRHPSPGSLDEYERSLTTRQDASDYVQVLVRQCATRYPSPMLLRRLDRMVRRIEAHDALQTADDQAGDEGHEPQHRSDDGEEQAA